MGQTMYLIAKRTADILLSATAILILSPLLLVTAIILKSTGEHLIIYRQWRIGTDYQEFGIYKFVTMRADSPKSGTITRKNDPRVLPVGKVLRKTKINELPQLFNILFGHMSVVGPRPLVSSEVAMYPPAYRDTIYQDNQPGLTGMGSLFFRNEEEIIAATNQPPEQAYREMIMPVKGALEQWYKDHKNARLDLKIVLLTAWAVLLPESAPVVSAFRHEQGMPPDVLDAYEQLQPAAPRS